CSHQTYRELEASTVLFYTGITRSASEVMVERNESIATRRDALRETREAAKQMARILEQGKSMKEFGAILQDGWEIKKIMGSRISSSKIDEWYERGMRAGAYGGKIIGAGGGGFMMFICPPEKQEKLKNELKELRPVPILFEHVGSKIIFVG